MNRYEGMDKILEGVRERAQKTAGERARRQEGAPPAAPMTSDRYDTIVGTLNNLLHQASELRELVVAEDAHLLTDGRREHLLMLLGQVLEELWNAEATLQGVS
jgi:hypothetical protein